MMITFLLHFGFYRSKSLRFYYIPVNLKYSLLMKEFSGGKIQVYICFTFWLLPFEIASTEHGYIFPHCDLNISQALKKP